MPRIGSILRPYAQCRNEILDGDVDIEGDLKAGSGQKFFTSALAIPGTLIGWYDQAFRKIELSDLPEDGAGKGIFKLDNN